MRGKQQRSPEQGLKQRTGGEPKEVQKHRADGQASDKQGGRLRQRLKGKLDGLRFFLGAVIDLLWCVYMLLVLVGLPFYYTEGFSHIGTDKAMFFRALNRNMGWILLPLAAVYLLLEALCGYPGEAQERKRAGRKGKSKGRSKTASDGQELCPSKLRGRLTVTDCFVLLYGAALLLSYVCSDYRETAWYGTDKGWYLGLFTQLAFVLGYFFTTRLWRPRKWMLYAVLPVSAAVFFLGYLDRFGIFLLQMQARSASFISTIGNINWYCGYAVSVFFAGAVLLWQGGAKARWQKVLLTAYTALGFAALITQGSDSISLALGAVMVTLFVLSAKDGERMTAFCRLLVLFSAACLVSTLLRGLAGERFVTVDGIVLKWFTTGLLPVAMTVVSLLLALLLRRLCGTGHYPQKAAVWLSRGVAAVCVGAVLVFAGLVILNTVRPGSIGALSDKAVFTFSNTWGSKRGGTWKAAVMCFQEQNLLHRLTGVGPDAMSAYLYGDCTPGLHDLLIECFGGAMLTNAHNEWLTVLVDTGVIGLVAFAGIMVSAICTFLKAGKRDAAVTACGICLLAYTANNSFSFQQTVSGATIFLLLGMGTAFYREIREEEKG